MATDGYFEITGTYDEDDGVFRDAEGIESFVLEDEHSIAPVEEFSLAVSGEKLLSVWKAMRAADGLEQEIGDDSVRIRMLMNGIDCKPEGAMNPRYGVVVAMSGSVKFEATDKHSPVTVETREIDLLEIEEHLIGAGLISESDRRSQPALAVPGPR